MRSRVAAVATVAAVGASSTTCAQILQLTLILPGTAAIDSAIIEEVQANAPVSTSSSSSSSSPPFIGSEDCAHAGAGLGAESTSDDMGWSTLVAILKHVATLAPPPPLTKCLGATCAGALFALMGMLIEGVRERGHAAKEKASASKGKSSSASSDANKDEESQKCAGPGQRRAAAGRSKACSSNGSAEDRVSKKVEVASKGKVFPSGPDATKEEEKEKCPVLTQQRAAAGRSKACTGARQAEGRSVDKVDTKSAAATSPAAAGSDASKEDEQQKCNGHVQRRASMSRPKACTGARGAEERTSEKVDMEPTAELPAPAMVVKEGAATAGAAPEKARLRFSVAGATSNDAPTSPNASVALPSPMSPLGPRIASGGRPRFGTGGCQERELSGTAKAERQVKSILNKLTRDKFDKLYAQLLDCFTQQTEESHAEVIRVVAREVFAKATMEHCFVEMYADVCAKLNEDLGSKNGVQADFRHALLDQCQQSFKVHLDPPRIDADLDYEARYEELVKYKTRMLGNVRLIGQLLKRRMLSAKIIFHCTDELLSIGSPEALETLCAFLETIGSTFDTPRWQGHARLEGVFLRAEVFAEDTHQCSRIRCLLKDLLDKRKNKWREHNQKVLNGKAQS